MKPKWHALSVACPVCKAPEGVACFTTPGQFGTPLHLGRRNLVPASIRNHPDCLPPLGPKPKPTIVSARLDPEWRSRPCSENRHRVCSSMHCKCKCHLAGAGK